MTGDVIAMGLISTVVSIFSSVVINEFFSRRRARAAALLLLRSDLTLTTDLLQMWLDRGDRDDWNGKGPRIRPLSSLSTLGANVADLPPGLLLAAQRLELLLGEAQNLCDARQDEYSRLRLKGHERNDPKPTAIEADWSRKVIGCLGVARELQRETDREITRVGRAALSSPV